MIQKNLVARHGRILVVPLIVLLVAAASTNFPLGSAQEQRVTLASGFTSKEPTIDGKIEDAEWATATQSSFPSKYGESTVYVMNDDRFLYIGVKVRDENLGDIIGKFDQIVVDFHVPDDNGKVVANDDSFGCAPPRTFDDAHFLADGQISADRNINGECAVQRIDRFNHFEIKHPLNSGEIDDIALRPGDSAAFRIVVFDDGKVADVFPKTTDARNPNTNKWAALKIASQAGGGGGLRPSPLVLGLAAVVVVGWVGWIVLMVRQRGKKPQQPSPS